MLKKYKEECVKEFYFSFIYRYQEIIKIYERFKRQFDFLKTKVVIINIIKDCKVYIRMKALRYKPYGEFQALSVFYRA